MKILAHGHYSSQVDTELPPLKELVKDTTGQAVRRVGRFIQLALIGAGRCLQGQTVPAGTLFVDTLLADTAVYLTSGRGDLEITLDVLEQMVEQGLPPKPLSFINTVSNSACFYLAKQFGLHGRSHFVTRRRAPLESALQLAALDIAEGSVQTALLGSVDICTLPLAQHRQRLAVTENQAIGEGSHWFLLASDNHIGDALGHVVTVDSFANLDALAAWLNSKAPFAHDTVFTTGQYVDEELTRALQAMGITMPSFWPAPPAPWYDSHCGLVLGEFLTKKPASRLLYIDSDHSGRYNVIELLCP